ncbi:MAG TPA: hypothetical protein VFT64_00725 [Rickettsiales bacterium]|nr:hypothetical protein [Rickettsiales bacterium]
MPVVQDNINPTASATQPAPAPDTHNGAAVAQQTTNPVPAQSAAMGTAAQDHNIFADMTRQTAEQDLAYLFDGKLTSATITHKHAPVTMHKDENPLHMHMDDDQERLRIALKFKDNNTEPEAAIQQIQQVVGNLPGFEIFNKLQPMQPAGDQIKELVQVNMAQEGKNAHGFTPDEAAMLLKWADIKEKADPTINNITNQPIGTHYWLENSAQNPDRVVQVAENIEARAEAIKAFVTESAAQEIQKSNAPNAAELLAELQNLQVQVIHSQSGEYGSINVKFGLPGTPDPQHPEKPPELMPSKALEYLMTQHSQGQESSKGENLVRYATTFVGDNWGAAFPHLAGYHEMKGFLEDRAAANSQIKAKVDAITGSDEFMTPLQRDEQGKQEANFRITTPGFHHKDDYGVDLALPKGMKAEQIYGAIVQAANAKKEVDKANQPPTTVQNPQTRPIQVSAPAMRL